MAELKQVLDELHEMRKEIHFIREHMVLDRDTVLTSEEATRFDESLKDYKEGKAKSLNEFEKEMAHVRNRSR